VHLIFARPETIKPVFGIRAEGGAFSLIIRTTLVGPEQDSSTVSGFVSCDRQARFIIYVKAAN
jgi:hypothetical protein